MVYLVGYARNSARSGQATQSSQETAQERNGKRCGLTTHTAMKIVCVGGEFFYFSEKEVCFMVRLDAENTVYDNIIEQYFHEFFENRGIDLYGNEYKTIPQNVFQAAFRYVYRKVFKPDENTTRKYRTTSKIDYDDAYTLNQIIDIFGDLVYSYDIKSTRNMFCDMTGIHRDTLHSWLNGNTRAYIYYNNNGEVIKDIQEYKLNNKGEYSKELSTSHSDLVKKIDSFSKGTAYNVLNDTPVGQITHANNSPEAGMEYNSKRQGELVMAHRALTASELPKLGGSVELLPDVKEGQ